MTFKQSEGYTLYNKLPGGIYIPESTRIDASPAKQSKQKQFLTLVLLNTTKFVKKVQRQFTTSYNTAPCSCDYIRNSKF